MPKKGLLLPKKELLTPTIESGTAEQALPIGSVPYYNSRHYLDIFTWDGGTVGISGVESLMTCFFNMEEWQADDAMVEFFIAGTMNTDAAAGTTSFRVWIYDEDFIPAGVNIATISGNELNSASVDDWIYHGNISIVGSPDTISADVGSVVMRQNTTTLYAAETSRQVSLYPATAVNRHTQLTAEVTIESSDAGTVIDNMQGWMAVTFFDPNRDNVLEGG